MRILFLSHYFPPEVNAPAVRTHEHCREWVRMGHEVHVVTCMPNHPHGRVYDGYRNRFEAPCEVIDGIRVHRVWTYVAANRGFVRRTLGYFSFMLSAPFRCLRIPQPDVIVATSPQFFCACAGHIVSRLLHRPWVFELRDLWPESIVAVGALRNAAAIAVLESVERRLYEDAAAVVAVTEPFKESLVERGIPESKIAVVPNGIDAEVWTGGGQGEVRKLLGLDSEFIVSYVGTHGMAHRLDTVLEAAELLREDDGLRFLLVGDGAERERLVSLARERSLGNVTFMGQVSQEVARRYLQASDVSLVLLKKASLFRTVLPSKMFEAMAAGNPIVLGVEGEARRVVTEAEAGLCIEPENADELARAVARLRDDAVLRRRLGGNGQRYVRRTYDRRRHATQMLRVLESVKERTLGI